MAVLAFATAPGAAGEPVHDELDRNWALVRAGGDLGIRGVFRFALEGAAAGYPAERLTRALELARGAQDLDPSSATYGNFKWTLESPKVLDRNGVEFSMQQAAVLARLYAGALDDRGRGLLRSLLRSSVEGIRRHKVPVTYTNMALMHAWNQVAIGELIGEAAFAGQGYRDLESLVAFTARNGICEYNSPNYYNTDLDSAVLLMKFSGRPEGRSEGGQLVRYLWTEIAANWFAPGLRLGGAHSRNYDYLLGRGELDRPLIDAGWVPSRSKLGAAQWLGAPHDHLRAFIDACLWNPPAALTEPIRSAIPRMVVQRWGEAPEKVAWNYVGARFALAASGSSNSSDDHNLLVYWPGGEGVVQTDFFLDGRGDPYGTRMRIGRDGHSKALHLVPFLAGVQRGPEVLQVLSDAPSAAGGSIRPGDASELNAQMILPGAAEVWQEGGRLAAGSGSAPAVLRTSRAFFIRMGDVAVAVRFVLASDTVGRPVRSALYVQDERGSPQKRVTLPLSESEPTGRATVAIWMRAREGLEAGQFAAFEREFEGAQAEAGVRGTALQASVAGERGRLEIAADPSRHLRIAASGGETPAGILAINGRDLGSDCFPGFGPR